MRILRYSNCMRFDLLFVVTSFCVCSFAPVGFATNVVTAQQEQQQDVQDELPEEQRVHKWTDSSGKFEVEAVLFGFSNKVVKLEKNNGEVIDVPYNMLSPKSKSLAKRLQRRIDKAKKGQGSGVKNPFGESDDERDKGKARNKKPEKKNPFGNDEEPAVGELPNDGGVARKQPGKKRNNALLKERKFTNTNPPNPNCPRCKGTGLVGPRKFRPWVVVTEGDARRINDQPVADCCPECQKGADPRANCIKYQADYEQVVANHKSWEQTLSQPMLLVQTRFMVLHSQFSEQETDLIAQALEGCEWHIQQIFGSLHFSNRSRAEDELFLIDRGVNVERFLQVMKRRFPARDVERVRRLAFSQFGPFSYQTRQQTMPQMLGSAVYGNANMQIAKALAAPGEATWIRVGFAAHMEKLVTKKNFCFMSGGKSDGRFAPEMEQQGGAGNASQGKLRRFNYKGDWDQGIREMVKFNRFIPWDTMMYVPLAHYQVGHDLQAKSMVGFLLQDAAKFEKMVDLISEGKGQLAAMEESYGKKVSDLEAAWLEALR